MKELNAAISTFYKDLDNQTDDLGIKLSERVLLSTFSEFGRKAKENGCKGTDYGLSFPMFVFGKGVKTGMVGTNYDLDTLNVGYQLENRQYDYRSVFSTILQDWLGANNTTIDTAFIKNNPNELFSDDLINDLILDASKSCLEEEDSMFSNAKISNIVDHSYDIREGFTLDVYPNPAPASGFHLEINSEESVSLNIQIVTSLGQIVYSESVDVFEGENQLFCQVDYKGIAVVKAYNSLGIVSAKNIILR